LLQKQKEAVNKSLFMADLVITTALVMGKKAPVLITEDQVKQMKLGAVIVDMAVEQGGNCELSELNKTVVKTVLQNDNIHVQVFREYITSGGCLGHYNKCLLAVD
jgi:NAD/NADP transhydrogenase alpha subunit